jgi:hypothetical protein
MLSQQFSQEGEIGFFTRIRAVDISDLLAVVEAAQELLSEHSVVHWAALRAALARLEEEQT